MVAFCHECKQSLPYADVIIKDGQEDPAPGYLCPLCGEPANHEEEEQEQEESELEDLDGEVLIRDGKLEQAE